MFGFGVYRLIFTKSLRKNFQFRYVYNYGKSVASKNLILFVKKNNLSVNRIGICVSKKIGKSHIRNRITRLIRESYRLNEKLFCRGFDIVFVAKRGILDSNFFDIKNSIIKLLHSHKILLNQK